jgi:hypothetical protein
MHASSTLVSRGDGGSVGFALAARFVGFSWGTTGVLVF